MMSEQAFEEMPVFKQISPALAAGISPLVPTADDSRCQIAATAQSHAQHGGSADLT